MAVGSRDRPLLYMVAGGIEQGEGLRMRLVPFFFYYLTLHFRVAFGLHYTSHPLDLRWRWSFWSRREDSRRRTY